MEMQKYVISIGSNCDEALVRVEESIDFLKSILKDAKVSTIYTTPSINADGSIYTNAVLSGYSDFTYEDINDICKDYESKHGRVKQSGSPVTIDMDVVIVDSDIVRPKDAAREYFIRGFREISDSTGNCGSI